MQNVVGIRFKRAGKIYYFDPDQLEIKIGDYAIVETVRGIEFGKVEIGPCLISKEDLVLPLKKIIRKATDADHKQFLSNQEAAKEALQICFEKVAEHGLEMKLVDVEYTFDRNKVIFYFTADGRVDFRELVKDFAAIFRTRIELRQIGVRDESKILGGIGPCGRMLCCATFLGDFDPVSIKMAKDQSLSLNPTKISGLCGRLMCCLKYENDDYEEIRDALPDVGDEIQTSEGVAKVLDIQVLTNNVQVQLLSSGKIIDFEADQLIQAYYLSKSIGVD